MKRKNIVNLIVFNCILGRVCNVINKGNNPAIKKAIQKRIETKYNLAFVLEDGYGDDKFITAENFKNALDYESKKTQYCGLNLPNFKTLANKEIEDIIQKVINNNIEEVNLPPYIGKKKKAKDIFAEGYAYWEIKNDCTGIVGEICRVKLMINNLIKRRLGELEASLDECEQICMCELQEGINNKDFNKIITATNLLQEVIDSKKLV